MTLKLQVDATPPRKSHQVLSRCVARVVRWVGQVGMRGVSRVARWSKPPTGPRGPYYLKLLLTMLGMGMAYGACSAYLQLYLDQQPITSIQNSRWYLVTKWNPYPQDTGELSPYREFMQPILAAEQLQVSSYVQDDARKDHQLYLTQQLERLRTHWQDYVVADAAEQALASKAIANVGLASTSDPDADLASVPVDVADSALTLASSSVPNSSLGDGNEQVVSVPREAQHGSLIPTDELVLPRGAARDVPYQLYVFRNEGLIPAFPASQRFVKFVVGYRGDVVLIMPHAIYVNNVWIRNTPAPVAQQLSLHSTLDPLHRSYRVVQLQAQQYWVMGDDPDSIDSAYFGPVSRKQFEGKVAWHF